MSKICIDCNREKKCGRGLRCRGCAGRIRLANIGRKIGIGNKGRRDSPKSPSECKAISDRMMGNQYALGHTQGPGAKKAKSKASMGNKYRWLGDKAGRHAGHTRAQKLFPIPESCSGTGPHKGEICRHHIDENTLNNDISNIEFLCRACHQRKHLGTANKRDGELSYPNKSLAKSGNKNPSWVGNEAKPQTGRSRAQVLYPNATECSGDGPHKGSICRHHNDENALNNSPENIRFLCRACHAREHAKRRRETKIAQTDTVIA